MRGGCSLVILAGGLSRRMGRDKASLPAGDVTLIEHLVRRLGPVVDETIVAGGSVRPDLPDVRLVPDRAEGLGPLAGMHAGLMAARHPHVWVVAVDLPDVQPAIVTLLREMSAGYDAVVPRIGGEPQGVCALYVSSLASRIDALLNAGERSIRSLLAASNVRYVTPEELHAVDPELRSFRNINTPSEYEAWLKAQPDLAKHEIAEIIHEKPEGSFSRRARPLGSLSSGEDGKSGILPGGPDDLGNTSSGDGTGG